jgi:phosphoesterase RecJ-like protein
MTREARGRAAAAILQANKIVLACHVNPDGDALGSLCSLGLALESLGRQVVMLSPDGVPDHCAFIPGSDRVLRASPTHEFDLGIGLDADGSDRLGSAEAIVLGAPLVIDVDHHVGAERYGQIRLVDPTAAATGELVYDLLLAIGAPLTPEIATGLMAAIVTDTGGFRYTNVTARTLEIAGALIGHGAHPAPIIERVYGRRTVSATRLLGTALAEVHLTADGRLAWVALDRAAFERAGARDEETDGIVGELRAIDGVGVAILLREGVDGEVRVSLRSRDGTDVAALAERFGGGGHRAAAGCTLPGPLPAAIESMLAAAVDMMKPLNHEGTKETQSSQSTTRQHADL